MKDKISQWIRRNYNKFINSIAFYPAFIAFGFLVLSVLMLRLDFTDFGKHLKAQLDWITLKDASTARNILATIAAGVLSLTVFSFSMVMIVLNQAASQMSNRMLNSMITNRFQQIILGFYIGTIVYALFLLSTIRDIDSGIYVPALSIYLLLLLTVTDIFLFIYFLHYVTQSVKFNTIIKRVHQQTLRKLEYSLSPGPEQEFKLPESEPQVIYMPEANYFQGFDINKLTAFACKRGSLIHFLEPTGAYLLKGVPLLHYYGSPLKDSEIQHMLSTLDFFIEQSEAYNSYYNYHQLAEAAIKALSPGINDPETAVLSLHALTDLFSRLIAHPICSQFKDEKGDVRVITVPWTFEKLFTECYHPIWDYGKNDHYVRHAMIRMLNQLKFLDKEGNHVLVINSLLEKIEKFMATEQA